MDLLNALLDQSGQLVVVLDCETRRVADCNDAYCRANGRTRDEIVGRPVSELHVSFPLQTDEQWQYFLSRVEAEPNVAVETQFRRADGSFYPVRVRCSLQEREGRSYVLVVGRAVDNRPPVQSRLERETRWQKALNQMAAHPAMAAGRFADVAAFIVVTGKSVFPADHCRIWRLRERRLELVADDLGALRAQLPGPIDLPDMPWIESMLKSGRSLDLLDTCRSETESERTRLVMTRYGCQAILCAPIRLGGQVWGALSIGSDTPRQWQADEVGFAAEVADQVAHAVSSQELRLSEERYRSFIAASAEAVWRISFHDPISLELSTEEQIAAVLDRGYLADCNDAFARIYARPREEFLGMPIRSVLAPVDAIKLAETRQLVESRYRLVDVEALHRGRWLSRNVTGVFKDGQLIHLWGTSRDITRRKRAEQMLAESEQRYRAFVANSSEGIFRVEFPKPVPIDLPVPEFAARAWQTGVVAECNDALAGMGGFRKPDDYVKLPDGPFPAPAESDVADFLQRGCRIADFERPATGPGGSVKWFSYSMLGVVERGALARIWGRVADVTARRNLEEELRALSARRATVLEQERTRISREIHDELGQQLTALKFEAAAVERGSHPPRRGELTASIDAAIHTVRRIATELRPAILDHFGLVAAIEWMSAEVSRRTGIECDCELESGLEIDPALATTVFRIFQEALTNAARHSGATMVQVRLRTNRDRLELIVQDNGKGFTGEGKPVTSLGLIGMRERAKDAGGAVKITGTPGRGTRVAAWFPLEAAA